MFTSDPNAAINSSIDVSISTVQKNTPHPHPLVNQYIIIKNLKPLPKQF